jgi:hypothetical protein
MAAVGGASRTGLDRETLLENVLSLDSRMLDFLDLTSGVTGRIVELLRLSSRCAMRYESRTLDVPFLQEAGKEFAADLGPERHVSH